MEQVQVMEEKDEGQGSSLPWEPPCRSPGGVLAPPEEVAPAEGAVGAARWLGGRARWMGGSIC
jgi:hypothetical protein